ncbi:Phosphopantothenoylcysteine decarboxylase [Spatholobus suberectus]|nr:Phosphopantothenoylcysteine decarboxylase [Spatholobus suberectus]
MEMNRLLLKSAAMDYSDPASIKAKSEAAYGVTRKPRVLLAACGCVAAAKFGLLCHCFIEWAEIRDPASIKAKSKAGFGVPRKPQILLAACGCVDAAKFVNVF